MDLEVQGFNTHYGSICYNKYFFILCVSRVMMYVTMTMLMMSPGRVLLLLFVMIVKQVCELISINYEIIYGVFNCF